jgi:hypothetical protein
MPIADCPILYAEASLDGKSTVLTKVETEKSTKFRKQKTKRKGIKKRFKLFQKIKIWWSVNSDEIDNVKVFIMGVGGIVLGVLGLFTMTGTFFFLAFLSGLFAIINGIIQMANGNSHWAVVVGFILGICLVFAPFVLWFVYLNNQEP